VLFVLLFEVLFCLGCVLVMVCHLFCFVTLIRLFGIAWSWLHISRLCSGIQFGLAVCSFLKFAIAFLCLLNPKTSAFAFFFSSHRIPRFLLPLRRKQKQITHIEKIWVNQKQTISAFRFLRTFFHFCFCWALAVFEFVVNVFPVQLCILHLLLNCRFVCEWLRYVWVLFPPAIPVLLSSVVSLLYT